MDLIQLEKKQKTAWITLNRVEKSNAFDDKFIALLTEQFNQLAQCSETMAIILNANGKHFSAGADLGWMKRMKDYSEQENLEDSLALAELLSTIYHHPKPVIASVQGCAYGGGAGLVAACDFAISEQNALFCFSEVKLGLIPAVISPYVIKAVGQRMAKKLFLTAERFDANQALNYQLVQEVCPENTLSTRTNQLAQQIVNNGPNALIACKKLVNDVSPFRIDQSLKTLTAKRIASQRVSNEGQEGLAAFFEKRQAQWMEQDNV